MKIPGPKRPRPAESLADFPGRDLARAIALLGTGSILGPWRKCHPHERRPAARGRPRFYTSIHAHAHAEVCHLLEGECALAFAGHRSRLRAGDIVFCPPGVSHSEGFVYPGIDYSLIWWILAPGETCVQMTRYQRRTGFAVLDRISCEPLAAEARRALGRLRAMTAAERPPALDCLRETLLTLALALLRRTLSAPDPAALDARPLVVDRASGYVRANAGRAIRVDDVSRAVLLSPNYLTALFRRHTGTPLGRFILEERIARARSLLDATLLPVKAVSGELDFSDAYSFSRAFKRVTGLSPTRYRARAAGRESDIGS